MSEVSINISKWTWPPGAPSVLQFLPVTGYGWHIQPLSLLPDALPYIIQLFWLPGPFVYPLPIRSLGPGHFYWSACPLSFSSISLITWSSSVWPCPLWILPDVHASGYAFPHIYNFLLHHTQEESGPFFCISFFHSKSNWERHLRSISDLHPAPWLLPSPLYFYKPSTALQANPIAQERCFQTCWASSPQCVSPRPLFLFKRDSHSWVSFKQLLLHFKIVSNSPITGT